jgi:hypothetical protein
VISHAFSQQIQGFPLVLPQGHARWSGAIKVIFGY